MPILPLLLTTGDQPIDKKTIAFGRDVLTKYMVINKIAQTKFLVSG